MARLVEDQEKGMVEVPQADPKGIAKDLFDKGYTLEDLKSTASKLPVNESITNELYAEFEALQPTRTPSKASESVSLEGMFQGAGAGLDFEGMFPQTTPVVQRAPQAENEMAKLISEVSGVAAQDAKKLLSEGEEVLTEAYANLAKRGEEMYRSILNDSIAQAQTPDEVEALLKDYDEQTARIMTFADFRTAGTTPKVPDWRADNVRDSISRNLTIAEELDKASQRVWEQAEYSDLFKDIGQLVMPFTGYAEEEITKWSVDFQERIKQLREAKNPDEAKRLVDQFVQAMVDTQTPIMERNNTFMTLQAIDSLATEFKDGAYGYVDGVVTEEEWRRGAETAVFGAVEATGLGGVADIVKTVAKRIFPSKEAIQSTSLAPRKPSMEGEWLGPAGELDPNLPSSDLTVPLPEYDPTMLPFRTGSSSTDEIAFENPALLREDIKNDGLKTVAESNNLSTEELADRMMPSVGDFYGRAYPDVDLGLTELNELNLINKDVKTLKAEAASRLQKDVGDAGVAQVSHTAIRPNDNPNSLGTFVMHVGGPDGSWFANRTDAEAVLDKLFGVDGEVVEYNGKYAVRASYDHTLDVKRDIKGPDADTRTSKLRAAASMAVQGGLLDPMRLMADDLFSATMALSDVNKAASVEMAERFNKSLKSWSHKKLFNMSRLLKEAETLGATDVRLTREMAKDAMPGVGGKEFDDLWKSYQEIRTLSDEIFDVADHRFRLALEGQGWRYGHFGDETDFVRKADARDINGNEMILDMRTGETVHYNNIDLTDDVTLVRTMNPRTLDDGEQFDLVLIRNKDTGALPQGRLLNKREGYVPRYYTETGWIIRRQGEEVVNGASRPSSRVTHIVGSKRQGVKALKKHIDDIVREEGLTGEAATARKAELNKEFKLERSRENGERDLIWGRENDVSFGFGSSNTKARGDQLLGSEGVPAPIMDPVQAFSKRINTINRDLNHSVISAHQARFMKQFGKVLADGERTAWNSNINRMMTRDTSADIDMAMKSEMEAMHGYVESLRQSQSASVVGKIDAVMDEWLSIAPLTPGIQWLKRHAAMIYITGRPMYQIPTNLAQIWAIVARATGKAQNPIGSIVGSIMLHSIRGTGGALTKRDRDLLSNLFHMSEDDAVKMYEWLWNESGLVKNTDYTDDILSTATDDIVNHAASVGKFYAQKAGDVIKSPLKASQALQAGALKHVNTSAFMAIMKEHAGEAGWGFNAKTKEKLLYDTRRLTQTQNRANQFSYQNDAGIQGMMLQFYQHIQKMFLDIALEPTMVAVLPESMTKGIRKRNLYAENRIVALTVTGFNLALFGTSGVIGANSSRSLGNEVLEEYPELLEDPDYKFASEVLKGGTINASLGGFSERVTPGAFVDTIYQAFTQDTNALEFFMGASGGYTSSVLDLAANMGTVLFTPEMKTEDQFYTALRETANLFAGAKDAEKAYIAYNFGMLPYTKNLSGSLEVNTKEAIAAAFSVTPEAALDRWAEMSKKGGVTGSSSLTGMQQRVNDLFVRGMNRELTALKSSGKDGTEYIREMLDIRMKWVGYAKAAHGFNDIASGEVENYFMSRTLAPDSPDYKQFVEPYIYQLDIDETLENLERLSLTTDKPKFKAWLDAELRWRKMLSGREENGRQN